MKRQSHRQNEANQSEKGVPSPRTVGSGAKHAARVDEARQDWDFVVPAPRVAAKKLKVKLVFAGRGKPLPFNPD
jgi:hypothetical protein